MSTPISQIDLLARILDTSSLRQRVISQNIANVNTPGYARLDVSFEDELAAQLGGGEPAAAAAVRPKVVESRDAVARADGNNVSLETELGDLNKNTLLYSTASQVLTARLGTYRAAIAGR